MHPWKKNLPWNNLWDCFYHKINPFVYKKLILLLLHHSYGTLIHCNKFLIYIVISCYWMTMVLWWNIAYTVLDRLVYQKPGLLFNNQEAPTQPGFIIYFWNFVQVLSLIVPTKVAFQLLKNSSVVILKNKKTWFLVTANFLKHPPLYPTWPLLLFLFPKTNFSFHNILRYFIQFPPSQPLTVNPPTHPPDQPSLNQIEDIGIFPANNHIDLNSVFCESICFFLFCCTIRPGFP